MAEEVLRLGVDPRGAVTGFRTYDRAADRSVASSQRMAGAVRAIGASMAAFAAARGVGAAVKGAMEWESALTGVAKTVEASTEQIQALGTELRNMSEQIPTTAVELASIAEAAGQLGIETSNITAFTRVMADLGVATNLSATEAATALARLANVMGTSQTDFDRLGSTVVDLGNNLATTEREIVEFGQRMAGAGRIAGLTEADVLAIGGAMSSVGVEAEAGGTAVQAALISINTAAAEGGAQLQAFANVAGMAAADFRDLWQNDASAAFEAFISGLADQGDAAATTLEELGLGGARSTRAFLSLANAGDLLSEALTRSEAAWRENNALTEEAAQFYDDAAQVLETMRNRITNTAAEIGSNFIPAIKALNENFEAVEDAAISLAVVLGAAGLAGAAARARVALAGIATLLAAGGPYLVALGAAGGAISILRDRSRELREEQERLEQQTRDLAASFGDLNASASILAVAELTAQYHEQMDALRALKAEQEAVGPQFTRGGTLFFENEDEIAELEASIQRTKTLLEGATSRMAEFGAAISDVGGSGGGGEAGFFAPLISNLELASELVPQLQDEIESLTLDRAFATSREELKAITDELEEAERRLRILDQAGAVAAWRQGLFRAPETLERATEEAEGLAHNFREAALAAVAINGEIRSIEGGAAAAAAEWEAFLAGLDGSAQDSASTFEDEWVSAINVVGASLGGLASQVANVVSAFRSGGLVAGAIAAGGLLLNQLTGGPSAAQLERERILQQNTEALRDLAFAMEGRGVTSQQAGMAASQVQQIIEAIRGTLEGTLSSTVDLPAGGDIMEFLNSNVVQQIAQQQGIELFTSNGRVITEALEQLVEAMGLYADELERQEAAFRDDLRVRNLEAQGRQEAADALRAQIAREREMQEARAAGMSEEALRMLGLVQAQEELIRAREAEAEAAREAARAAMERRQFALDLAQREASLAGNDQGAARLRLQAQAEAELFRAQQLLDAGRITEEMFRRLEAVLTGEVNRALADMEEAARRAAQQITNDLNLRLLRARGLEDEALALQQLIELEEARREGWSAQQIALLEQVQAAERAQRAQRNAAQATREVEQAARDVSRALNAPQGLRLSLLRWRASALGRPGANRRPGGGGGGGLPNEPNPPAEMFTGTFARDPVPNPAVERYDGPLMRSIDTTLSTLAERPTTTIESGAITVTIDASRVSDPKEVANLVRQQFDRMFRAGGDPLLFGGQR